MATTPPAAPSKPAAPFTRFHHPDPAIDRICQDLYDKLAQANRAIQDLKAVQKP